MSVVQCCLQVALYHLDSAFMCHILWGLCQQRVVLKRSDTQEMRVSQLVYDVTVGLIHNIPLKSLTEFALMKCLVAELKNVE